MVQDEGEGALRDRCVQHPPRRLHRANIARVQVPLPAPVVRSTETMLVINQRRVDCASTTHGVVFGKHGSKRGAARHNGPRLPSQVGQPKYQGGANPSLIYPRRRHCIQNLMQLCTSPWYEYPDSVEIVRQVVSSVTAHAKWHRTSDPTKLHRFTVVLRMLVLGIPMTSSWLREA